MSDSFEARKGELLDLIAEAVNLRNLDYSTFGPESPLMGGGLGLDSIDVLEVVIALEKKYQLKIENNENSRKIFTNLGTLADFISHKQFEKQKLGAELHS